MAKEMVLSFKPSSMNTKILLLASIFASTIYATSIDDYINKKNCDQIIDKQVFEICYDYKAKGARYVAYKLDGNLVNDGNVKERAKFYSESTIPMQYRSKSSDYARSGYDRGHLANDASFDYDEKIVVKTYTMANIIPQAPLVNQKTWIKAEKYERLVASKIGSVSVINGVNYSSNPKRIGDNQIAIPDSFWKMIYNDKINFKKCFLYQNDNDVDVKLDKLENHEVDCSLVAK